MIQDQKLYNTAPTDEIFEDMKKASFQVWNTYNNDYGYVDQKINAIKDLKNVGDNFMYMFSMFDIHNQLKIWGLIDVSTKEAVKSRLPLDYLDFYANIGLYFD